MSARDDGGRAFPLPVQFRPDGELIAWHEPGMSLRDAFAIAALPALLADFGAKMTGRETVPKMREDAAKVTSAAYIIADLMIEARK